MALLRLAMRRGEFILTWVPSRANISDSLTIERENGAPTIAPDLKVKKVLLDALRTNNTQLKGIRRVTRTKEDLSRY